MNTWQVLKQLRSLLSAATWDDGQQRAVFGKVIVSAGAQETGLGQLRFPLVVITPADAQVDDDSLDLFQQALDVRLAVRVASDPWGQDALLGGPRGGGQGTSMGRGLLEVEEVLLQTLFDLQEKNGVRLKHSVQSSVEPVQDETHGYVAIRDYRFQAWCTFTRSYEAPTRFAGADQGGGNVDLTWALPASRFDLREVVLRRAAGATPPSTPDTGTSVALGSLLATAVTDSPGAGQFSYALFAGYDELSEGSSSRYSAAATLTATVT